MYDCVMPAAGAASRMGRLKQLLPLRGSTIVELSAGAALAAGARLLLVLGHAAYEVEALFRAPAYAAALGEGRLHFVPNPLWEEGLLGSIQAALPLVRGEAFFVAHADMPFVEIASYAGLAAAFEEGGPPRAVFAAHGGRRGHPALLPSAWIPEILALDPRLSLGDFASRRPCLLVETGSGALRDIDTPGDYGEALERRG